MNKLEKKLIVILVSFIFLTMGIVTSSAISIQNNKAENIEKSSSETAPLTKTVTLYRHGLDGSIKPVKVTINLEEDKDINEAISDKCDELLENDEEIQKYLEERDNDIGLLCKVKSKGKGFHYQALLLEKLIIRYLLFRLTLPRIHSLLNKQWIFCRYKNDLTANTTITPLVPLILQKKELPRYMEGKHSVICLNFLGFTSWVRRFSLSPLDIFPRSFSGIADVVILRKL